MCEPIIVAAPATAAEAASVDACAELGHLQDQLDDCYARLGACTDQAQLEALRPQLQAEAEAIRRTARDEAAEAAVRARRESEAEARAILDAARLQAQREKDKLLDSAKQEVSLLAVDAVKKLMNESLSESYDEFLSLAERSEADA